MNENPSMWGKPMMTQRDAMRAVLRKVPFGSMTPTALDDHLAHEFAEMVKRGQTVIQRNKNKVTPLAYGYALARDGWRRGWLK